MNNNTDSKMLARVINQKGLREFQEKNYKEALIFFKEATDVCPTLDEAYNNMAHTYLKMEDNLKAEVAFRTAIEINPNNFAAMAGLSQIFSKNQQWTDAEYYLKLASLFSKEDPAWLKIRKSCLKSQLAEALREQNKIQEMKEVIKDAEILAREAHKANPDIESLLQIGKCLQEQHRYPEAEKEFIKAENESHDVQPSYLLGRCYQEYGRWEDAEEKFKFVIDSNPGCTECYADLALVLSNMGRYDEAMEYYDKSIKLDPEQAVFHLNKSLCMLSNKDEKGWEEYKWRFQIHKMQYPRSDMIQWTGGKTKHIVVVCEQGYGDSIQFIRYALTLPIENIIIQCQPTLVDLFKSMNAFKDVIPWGYKKIPEEYKCFVPLMSIPSFTNTQAKVPYIFANKEKSNIWKSKFKDINKLKVGITWQGNKQHLSDFKRSMKLTDFEPLSKLDVQLISLQRGSESSQTENVDWIKTISISPNWHDTAAILDNLDLIISVDSGIVHLAGALNKEVWIIHSYAKDWRWFFNEKWYNKTKHFHQEKYGEWSNAIKDVVDELKIYKKDSLKKNSKKTLIEI